MRAIAISRTSLAVAGLSKREAGLQHLMTIADGYIFRDKGYLRVYSYHSAASDVAFAH